MTHTLTFNEETHTYTLDGRPVPSVTTVLGDLLPTWKADDWYLERGRAVHACAAFIGRDEPFAHDEQIDGQVKAIERFYYEVDPTVLAVEQTVFSPLYQYAGTLDLLCTFNRRRTVIDFKASVTDTVLYQLGAYALAEGRATHGMGVEIRADGTYRMGEHRELTKAKREWLALLTAYNIRRKCGVKEEDTGMETKA
jgi:hypothetical protein